MYKLTGLGRETFFPDKKLKAVFGESLGGWEYGISLNKI
jgi:hypothetical protein